MTQLFVNNFAATVAQTFGAADQYLYLNTVTGLPALSGGNHLLLTLFRKVGVVESGHEVVKVTAITDLMLTVERSVEGADATLFNIGDRVEARVTAGALGLKADAADAYVHPANHPPSIITQDSSNRFVTDAEKTVWDGKQTAGDYATNTNLALKASLASPALTGTPTAPTAAAATNTTQLATTAHVFAERSNAATLANKTLTMPVLTGYKETVFSLTGTVIDPANGTIQVKTLSANTTFTESLSDGDSVTLMLNPVTFSTTWPTLTWITATGTGTAPTLKASAFNVIVMWQVGGVLYAMLNGSV